jgi:hypothetical protein
MTLVSIKTADVYPFLYSKLFYIIVTCVLFQICYISTFFILQIDYSSYQMKIEIKFPRDNNSHIGARLACLTLILTLIFFGIHSLELHFQHSRRSLFPLSSRNMTYANIMAHCIVPFDDCRCSVLSNKFNTSIKCITDVAAMAGHILPLVSYAFQLYFISKIFSFKGTHSHILTDIFWVVALFVFIIIAIGVHGSSCLHSATNAIVFFADALLLIFLVTLFKRRHNQNSSHETDNISRHERTVTDNNDREIVITVTVSSLSYYLAPLSLLVLYIMLFLLLLALSKLFA